MEIPSQFSKSILWALAVTVLSVGVWELYWRKNGYTLSYNDNNAAWAHQRAKVDKGNHKKVVMIGSSRIQFDMDLDTYHKVTGDAPIQLARGGTCPLPVLDDLANDSLFTGTLIIGVTEMLFFSPPGRRPVTEIQNFIKYYHHEGPAQKATFGVGRFLESKLLFLDQEGLSLNIWLNRLPLPAREGVWVFPNFAFDWASTSSGRQSIMTEKFVNSPAQHQEMRDVWGRLGLLDTTSRIDNDALSAIINSTKVSIAKLRERGVQVFFVRFPSGDPFWKAEQSAFPRALYWDRLLKETQTPGIHFEDYPALLKYYCPEGSHLTPDDAVSFTKDLIEILKTDKGLTFVSFNP